MNAADLVRLALYVREMVAAFEAHENAETNMQHDAAQAAHALAAEKATATILKLAEGTEVRS